MAPTTGLVPDRWVIVKIGTDEPVRRVLAGWLGSYLYGDSWRLSSAVIEMDAVDDGFQVKTESGSEYFLRKQLHGLTSFTSSVYNQLQGEYPEIEIEETQL